MFGISYGEIFLIIGATAALVGPKDLPIIARTAGRLAGKAIGYVQLARGQFENVMQQSQARQVQKELQDAMQQLEAIRHEIRSVSLINPGPLTRKLMDNPSEPTSNHDDSALSPKYEGNYPSPDTLLKDCSVKPSASLDLHSQATAYARLAESEAVKSGSLKSILEKENSENEAALFTVLPVSAESTGMLPGRKGLPWNHYVTFLVKLVSGFIFFRHLYICLA
ncbi:sec-independent protein translocase protein TatB isoform X2 [Mangifera indica]|uniref:sec-independent protein translocase protein TatB isoform X2 n=1 Tax=Mangifera indica TaxID=29780 RepID=UPI001CF9DD34|nr:sec-independent protein translocase protein TatB isoform X2 [Mangifera indica]